MAPAENEFHTPVLDNGMRFHYSMWQLHRFDAVKFGAFSKMNLLMEINCGNKLPAFLSETVFAIIQITYYSMGVEERYLLLIA